MTLGPLLENTANPVVFSILTFRERGSSTGLGQNSALIFFFFFYSSEITRNEHRALGMSFPTSLCLQPQNSLFFIYAYLFVRRMYVRAHILQHTCGKV